MHYRYNAVAPDWNLKKQWGDNLTWLENNAVAPDWNLKTADKAIKHAMTFAYKVNLVKQIILLACKLGGVRLMSDIELERRR